MNKFFENLTMKNQRKYTLRTSKIIFLLSIIVSMTMITCDVSAKSLYVLSDIKANPQPLQVYDIAADGKLTFQSQFYLPKYTMGAVRIAMDSDSGYLFFTYLYWNYILIADSKTMSPIKIVKAPGSQNLAGIVYNHKKSRLYCVDSGRDRIWVYNWDPKTASLTLVDGAPFFLRSADAYGIALDEVDQLLYVANSTNTVTVYSTVDWTLTRTITLNRTAVSIAVDVKNGYLYTGGGIVGNPYLTQYNLSSGTQLETVVEPDSITGVMEISVDPNSSRVYITTGESIISGGYNIRIYDKLLYPIGVVGDIGHPTGLIVPGKEVGYNPLGLSKSMLKIVNKDGSNDKSIDAGDTVTYRINISNKDNDFTVRDVYIEDILPDEVSFVSASDDGVFGEYDPVTHIYTWLYPTLVKGSSAILDITVKINDDVPPRTSFVNTVTVNSNSTPKSTTSVETVTASYPLNIKKTVFGATEGQTKWVDVNEVITYNIYLDNNDNNFPATDIIVTDTLPKDVNFVKADYEGIFGLYNKESHTFTWSIPSLAPQEAADFAITVRLKDNVAEGTTLTNIVTAQSKETSSSLSSVDIRVGEGPLMVKSTQVIPSTIRRDSTVSGIMAILEMPLGYQVKDIKNTPLLLSVPGDPAGITIAANAGQLVTSTLGKTYIMAIFDKKLVMNAIEGYGPKNIQIEGTLTTGGFFTGNTIINITRFVGN